MTKEEQINQEIQQAIKDHGPYHVSGGSFDICFFDGYETGAREFIERTEKRVWNECLETLGRLGHDIAQFDLAGVAQMKGFIE